MAVVETLSLLSLALFLLYFFFTKRSNYWAKRNIPYESPIPFFGNFFDTIIMRRNAGQVITDIYGKFKGEKVVGMFNFTSPCLLIRDPTLVNQILTTNFSQFHDNGVEVDPETDPIFSKNVFVQTGEKWKLSRQRLSPAFSTGKIKSTYEKIQSVADKLVDYLEKNPDGEVKGKMSLYTSEIVAAWGMGIDGHAFDSPDPILPRLGKLMFEPSSSLVLSFTIMKLSPFLTKLLRIKVTPDEIPQFFDILLREIIKTRADGQSQHQDFLQYFMDLKKRKSESMDETEQISEDDIISALVSFFIEGYETSSIVLSHMLYELCLNPDVQETLRREIDALWKTAANGKPSFDAIMDAPFLSRTYLETNRLYGALALNKLCTETTNLDIGNGRTFTVEKGSTMSIPVRGIQRDAEYWPEPERFNPDRFIDFTPTKGTYLPFGDGPRICIGMRIASASIKTAAAHIIRNFELVPTKDTAPKFVQETKHFMAMLKGGVHLKFVKRDLKPK